MENLKTKLERMDKNTEVGKCSRNHLDVLAKVGMFASDTSRTNNAPYCRWTGLFNNNKKWKIKLDTEHAKPGSSATQHNYYFANVGTLKKCLFVGAEFWRHHADVASALPSLKAKTPLTILFFAHVRSPVDRWERLGVDRGSAAGYCSSLAEGGTYSELRGLMKESFKRSKPDWLVLLLRRGHLWQELLLQRQ